MYNYQRASLVVQLVKNPPGMQETWIQSLGWEDPLEKGKSTPSSIVAWRKSWTQLRDFNSLITNRRKLKSFFYCNHYYHEIS